MKIEEGVQQRQFKHAYHKLAMNLMYTTGLLETYLKGILKKQSITLQQYNILRILRGSNPNPLSTLQIRERMMDKMSDTSRIVDRLLLKALVTKKTCPDDNRLVDVLITEKGLQLLTKFDDIEDKIAQFMRNISEAEAAQANTILDHMNTDNS